MQSFQLNPLELIGDSTTDSQVAMHFIAFLPLYCFTLLVAYGSLAAPTDPPICNGHAKLCPREYSNVTFIGAHDSAFVGILPTQNQIKSVTDQLNSGIRFLQAQTHSFLDSIYLCHTSCFEVCVCVPPRTLSNIDANRRTQGRFRTIYHRLRAGLM
jgi:hypothetical protein